MISIQFSINWYNFYQRTNDISCEKFNLLNLSRWLFFSITYLIYLKGFEVVGHPLQRESSRPYKRDGLVYYHIFYGRILYY